MPHIILTPGDPTGIGPEITIKALQKRGNLPPMRITVIGSLSALEKATQLWGCNLPQSDEIAYRPIEGDKPGAIAYHAIETAVEMIAAGNADALVTGPISKRHLTEAGVPFDGHTETLENLAQRYYKNADIRAEMIFVYKNLRLLLLTRHIALRDVSAALAVPGAVTQPIEALIAYLRDRIGIAKPRLAMLGLNPHAGELEGSYEENKFFAPAIQSFASSGAAQIDGPFPADGFFRNFDMKTSPFDALIAPYHDMGLIPFKMMAGYEAVNVTIGLPFLRTSVSHGTADDIAGKGIAREDSMLAALRLAAMGVDAEAELVTSYLPARA